MAMICAVAFTGCHASWCDRVDFRPMQYGSLSDKLHYRSDGPCDGYRPWYHCGSPDGICDRHAVRKAAIRGANQSLAQQCCGPMSRDFEFGFQQAFIDIANGGSGALPTIPPPRYWTAAYRTTWGHHKAQQWFEGYQAGASAAKCGALHEAQTVPTTACRELDPRVCSGMNVDSNFTAPLSSSTPAGGWDPYASNPFGMNPYWTAMPAPMPSSGSSSPPWPLPSGHSLAPASPSSSTHPAQDVLPSSNSESHFWGISPSGFRSEGASR